MEKIKVSLGEIVEATGESLPTVHAAIKCGHLRTFLVGRRRYARPNDVRAWIDHLQSESDAGRPIAYRARSITERRA
ncbi:MAG: hypothetical protein RBU21_24685 [FCB group bacterium]|nr:hypothetical protein [FCB group bacterium]